MLTEPVLEPIENSTSNIKLLKALQGLREKFRSPILGKPSRPPDADRLAEAPSVRKGEIFRATKKGLERLQTGELRSGGTYNRKDEMPYSRITSVSYEERVMARGSRVLSSLGIILLVAGLGIPALSTLIPMLTSQVIASKVAGLQNSLVLPDLATVSIGVYLLASRFPRKLKEGWWQVKGQGITADDFHGWQIAGNAREADQLVNAVKQGISQASKTSGANTS